MKIYVVTSGIYDENITEDNGLDCEEKLLSWCEEEV